MNKTVSIIFILLVSSIIYSQSLYAELQDPTRPPANINGPMIVSPSLFILNTILIAPDHKVAVINGVDKKIGDEILGERVTLIDENIVQLEGPSGKITLFLFGQPIKSVLYQNTCKRKGNLCTDVR